MISNFLKVDSLKAKSYKLEATKGFTLIELLVVIAIIGILSGIVLTSLGTARAKAKVSSAQASISSMRSQAELGTDSSGQYIANLCPSTTTGGLGTLRDAVNAQIANTNSIKCGGTGADNTVVNPAWGFAANLSGLVAATYYCADSTGFAGSINATQYGAAVGNGSLGNFAGGYGITAANADCQ